MAGAFSSPTSLRDTPSHRRRSYFRRGTRTVSKTRWGISAIFVRLHQSAAYLVFRGIGVDRVWNIRSSQAENWRLRRCSLERVEGVGLLFGEDRKSYRLALLEKGIQRRIRPSKVWHKAAVDTAHPENGAQLSLRLRVLQICDGSYVLLRHFRGPWANDMAQVIHAFAKLQ